MLGKFFKKPRNENDGRVPPGQYLTNGFPVMTYGRTPKIEREDWRLKVHGLAQEKEFTWEQFMALPMNNFTIDFHCVTRWSKLDVQWTGVKVTDFLNEIQIDPKAQHVMAHCYGGYTTNIPLNDFARPENFFAYLQAGEPLAQDHGGPLRLVIPHLYAWKSAKWLSGLEFLETEKLGFWELNGYHRRGEPFAEERYSN
ncbi:MAG: sulfite oxidase-like oxidoreductase [Anaerolineae bacterium]|nr:sulfite oxidase-like oxidoreductase [Gloeobacterales cyanobacterium ES-bin-313]